jgi:hypothetical protein
MALLLHARGENGIFKEAGGLLQSKLVTLNNMSSSSYGLDSSGMSDSLQDAPIIGLEHCTMCDCVRCNTSEFEVVTDFSLTNIYGKSFKSELHKFLASFPAPQLQGS